MGELHFVEIILPLALPGTFTYEIDREEKDKLSVGQRVSVPFGSNKLYTGIIHSFHQNKPELFKTKRIDSILDEQAVVTENQIRFWEWMADYYMCSLGDVYRTAIPTALKWESETMLRFTEQMDEDMDDLTDDEKIVVQAIGNKGLLSVKETAKLIERKSAIPVVKSLWEKGIVRLDEILIEKYTPKIELYVKVNSKLKSNQRLFIELMEKLKNANRQRELLLKLIVEEQQSPKPIKVSKFLKEHSGTHTMLRSMEDKSLVEIYEQTTSRIDSEEIDVIDSKTLSEEQNKALKSVSEFFDQDKAVLLHGITSSGKTEIYIKLIEECLIHQQTVLFLLPEISIASQMVARIRKHFGEITGIYHSKFNQSERVELWQKTLNGEYKIIIGARSAIFLPFRNIGLIIVDEEHESAYKQNDSKPFFNARDMALVMAAQYNSQIILGSATPSLETYHNAVSRKYGYVTLSRRFSEVELPKIELVDLRSAMKNKEISGDISHRLKDAIQENFASGKQILIFQNRRGFAPVVECLNCGHTPYCPNCDVPLTFHKRSNSMRCHYCGHAQAMMSRCHNCLSREITTKGIGTQQIEEQLKVLFPKMNIARMDVDAMRRKHAYEKTLDEFDRQEIDLLVGTQMIAKGLDFKNIGLVGVIRADSILNFPDFRAHEKAFQLLTQVAGRSGRRKEQGRVLIQTFNPDHEILQNVIRYDYKNTARNILYERKSFLYPPFIRLIRLSFRHNNRERNDKVAEQFVCLMKNYLDEKHLLGPEEPPVNRIRNQYIQQVLIKIPENQKPGTIKRMITGSIDRLHTVAVYRSVKIDIDVDPL